MLNGWNSLFAAAAFLFAVMLAGAPASADDEYLRDGDIPLGAEDAPVTIIEYASMTCPHCAAFHTETMPQLKKEYVDTGKVRFIFREFPLDRIALRASMVARCAKPEKYYNFIDFLFKQQRSWLSSPDPIAALGRMASFGGMKKETFDRCMQDRDLKNEIMATRLHGDKEMGVQATPTLFVNGEMIPGAASFETLDKKLRKILGN